MAYTIDTYSNSRSWRIEDGTIDQTTDLKLVGKNYAGYGEIQNENFVFLLENFAGQTEPPRKITGQLWFDTGNSKLKFYDGVKWRTTGGAEVSSSVPVGLKQGDFWWDTNNEQLYTYNGGEFVLIGPQSVGSGQTQIVSRSVRDTNGNTKPIIAAVVNDVVAFTISSEEFTIDGGDVDSAIDGFDRIRQGITLKDTPISRGGVTFGNYQFHGTASNAEKLGGSPASEYITKTNPSFSGTSSFPKTGIQIGLNGDLKLAIELDNKAVISNTVGTQIEFRAKNDLGVLLNPVRFFANSVTPGFVPNTETSEGGPQVAVSTLGTVDYRWNNVYADNLTGLAVVSSSILDVPSGSSYDPVNPTEFAKYPSITATNNTVAIRDDNGDLTANYFRGIATEALYADLAEKYTTDQEYPVGTVMMIGEHDDYEAEMAVSGSVPIGVISTEPAYLMNAEADGQAIGLKGRVPVRIIGAVKKGQPVYVHANGVACATCHGPDNAHMVGIALENNNLESEKTVECVLKV